MNKEESLIFDIKLNTKDIWLFSMYNANRGFLGIFNVVFTLISLYYLIAFFDRLDGGRKLILLLFSLLFTLIQPALLYLKSAKQAKNENIRAGMRISFDDKGFEISQAEQKFHYAWDAIYKTKIKRTMIIIYTDSIRAYLIPKRYWKEDAAVLLSRLKSKTKVSIF